MPNWQLPFEEIHFPYSASMPIVHIITLTGCSPNSLPTGVCTCIYTNTYRFSAQLIPLYSFSTPIPSVFYYMLKTTMMNALRFTQKGAVENLRLAQVPKPTLSAGEALVQVRAAGINGVRSFI
jgi:hypothetical protein